MAVACSDEFPKLRLPRPREGLARDPPSDQLDVLDAPPVELLEELSGIGEVAYIPEAAEVC
jgi:hypothetical protein